MCVCVCVSDRIDAAPANVGVPGGRRGARAAEMGGAAAAAGRGAPGRREPGAADCRPEAGGAAGQGGEPAEAVRQCVPFPLRALPIISHPRTHRLSRCVCARARVRFGRSFAVPLWPALTAADVSACLPAGWLLSPGRTPRSGWSTRCGPNTNPFGAPALLCLPSNCCPGFASWTNQPRRRPSTRRTCSRAVGEL
eukprot:SAG22_NODE_1060_length_5764_cov_2.176876_2_plen_195_part_00